MVGGHFLLSRPQGQLGRSIFALSQEWILIRKFYHRLWVLDLHLNELHGSLHSFSLPPTQPRSLPLSAPVSLPQSLSQWKDFIAVAFNFRKMGVCPSKIIIIIIIVVIKTAGRMSSPSPSLLSDQAPMMMMMLNHDDHRSPLNCGRPLLWMPQIWGFEPLRPTATTRSGKVNANNINDIREGNLYPC